MNPSRTGVHQTNCSKRFEITLTAETGLSDFHKLIVTVLKVNTFTAKGFSETDFQTFYTFK